MTLFAIASQSIAAQAHMPHLVRPLSNLQIAEWRGARLLLRPCVTSRPKAFSRRITQRTHAWFYHRETFKSHSSKRNAHLCHLVCDRVPKLFCADSHDARLCGSTATKLLNRRSAWSTFTFATLLAIAYQSVFVKTRMTHTCVVRPLPHLQFAGVA